MKSKHYILLNHLMTWRNNKPPIYVLFLLWDPALDPCRWRTSGQPSMGSGQTPSIFKSWPDGQWCIDAEFCVSSSYDVTWFQQRL